LSALRLKSLYCALICAEWVGNGHSALCCLLQGRFSNPCIVPAITLRCPCLSLRQCRRAEVRRCALQAVGCLRCWSCVSDRIRSSFLPASAAPTSLHFFAQRCRCCFALIV
jgi:hypothetical protein